MFAALREQAAAAAEHAAAAAAQAAEQASSLSLSEATSRLSIATSSLQFFPEDGAPPEAAPSSDEPYAGTVKFDLDDEPAPAPSAAAPVPVTPGKPALDVLCAQQRRALEAGEQRIRALVEELNSTKLKALKRMREKDEQLASLEAALKTAQAKESAMQLENARLRTSGDAKALEPVAVAPLIEEGAAAVASEASGARVKMLMLKVTEQAAELHRERSLRAAAERASAVAEEAAAELRESLATARAAAEREAAEARALRRAPQTPAHSQVPQTPTTGHGVRGLEARVEAAEAARAQLASSWKAAAAAAAKELRRAEEAEAALAEARQALATAEAAREEAAAEAREAKAEAKQVKQKARALLGQQEEEMRRRTLPAGMPTPLPPAAPPAPDMAPNMAPDMTGLEWTMRAAAEAPNMAPRVPNMAPDMTGLEWTMRAAAEAPNMAPAQTALVAVQQARPGAVLAHNGAVLAHNGAVLAQHARPGGVRRVADAATSAAAGGAGVGGASSAVVGTDGAVTGEDRAVVGDDRAVVSEGSDEGSTLQRLALSQARLQAEISVERIRSQALEGELSAALADLQQLRQQAVLQADSQNLDYVRHVIVKFIELEGTDESDQLFEVIATVLQFEEKDVLRLVKALAERKAAARGRLSRLFGL